MSMRIAAGKTYAESSTRVRCPSAQRLGHTRHLRCWPQAEGRVHRIPPEEVTFHEVGALDAIVDICGVALALDELDVDEVVCSPLPLGHGTINSAHGVLPLPAPATLEILRGADTFRGRHQRRNGHTHRRRAGGVIEQPIRRDAADDLVGHRHRCGQRRLARRAQRRSRTAWVGRIAMLRNLVRPLLILETNLDDMLPEWVPDVLAACLTAGAHDAWTTPATMKHGRPGFTLSALVSTATERAVARAILRHSTTLGVRVRRVEHRWALERRFGTRHRRRPRHRRQTWFSRRRNRQRQT